MPRPQPVPPDRFARLVGQLHAQLDELVDQYRWAHDVAWAAPTSSAARIGSRPTGAADPTGAFASSHQAARAQLMPAVFWVEQATEQAKQISHVMLPAPTESTERPDQYPRTITRQEREESMLAKFRRQQRGEGWGAG